MAGSWIAAFKYTNMLPQTVQMETDMEHLARLCKDINTAIQEITKNMNGKTGLSKESREAIKKCDTLIEKATVVTRKIMDLADPDVMDEHIDEFDKSHSVDDLVSKLEEVFHQGQKVSAAVESWKIKIHENITVYRDNVNHQQGKIQKQGGLLQNRLKLMEDTTYFLFEKDAFISDKMAGKS